MISARISRALLALPLAACAVEESVGTDIAEIKNGTNWDPWTQTTQTWTRNVVRISSPVGGCTGTLLDYEWVMSAGHCFQNASGPVAQDAIQVSHQLADGSTETATSADYAFHPNVAAGVDVAMVHLATPLHPGVATLPLDQNATSDIVGQDVFCAGYGAIAAGPSCSAANPSCPSGYVCDTGWSQCMMPNDGPLKTATFHVISDPDNADTWYRFQVPNAQNQLELPGDSGSSCWSSADGGLTGVDKAGNSTNYNRQTSIAAARDWIESLVTPAVISTENRPGSRCHAVSGTLGYDSASELVSGASGGTAVCPIDRPIAPSVANEISVPDLWVVDNNASQDVCCHLQFTGSSGITTEGEDVCTSGASTSVQTLSLSSLVEGYTFSNYSISCGLPSQSRLESYRITARHR